MTAVWIIYLADVVGGAAAAFFILGIIFLLASSIAWLSIVVHNVQEEDGAKTLYKLSKKLFPTSLIMIALACLIPSKTTVYMIAAAKVGQDIVSQPQTKEIGDKVLKLINQKLDDAIGEKAK